MNNVELPLMVMSSQPTQIISKCFAIYLNLPSAHSQSQVANHHKIVIESSRDFKVNHDFYRSIFKVLCYDFTMEENSQLLKLKWSPIAISKKIHI